MESLWVEICQNTSKFKKICIALGGAEESKPQCAGVGVRELGQPEQVKEEVHKRG